MYLIAVSRYFVEQKFIQILILIPYLPVLAPECRFYSKL